MRKKITLWLLLSCLVMASQAQTRDRIGPGLLGESYQRVLSVLRDAYGRPSRLDSSRVVYCGKDYDGFHFDTLEFDFQYGGSRSYFNQARFSIPCTSKDSAVQVARMVADKLSRSYMVSYDEEDDHTPFYIGGHAPHGTGALFTIYIIPRRGRWLCQLRYGPFNFIPKHHPS